MRARNIKPAIFKNEVLARLGPWHFILFEGLWCLADRKGRLEDRPDRIEAEIFPFKFQQVDTNKLLDDLASDNRNAFILRYAKNRKRYIQIVTFEKHQWPHIREPESTIPAPGKNRTRTGSAHLNPSSLNPESPYPDVTHTTRARLENGNGQPYPIPDPKQDPAGALVMAYKTLFKKIPHDDHKWDVAYGATALKAARLIVEACGGFALANKCLEHYGLLWDKDGLADWTLSGVAKQAPAWMAKRKGHEHGRMVGKRFFGALSEQRQSRERVESPANRARNGADRHAAGLQDTATARSESGNA